MANSTNMAVALAAIFGQTLTSVEGLSRALKKAGLRTDGGKGRGASNMVGQDTFNLAIVLAAGVGMTAAPAFVRNVIDMELKSGVLLQGEQVVWAPGNQPPRGSTLGLMKQDLLPGVEVTSTLGAFMGNWIDGLFDATLPWKEEGVANLEIGLSGPWADFTLEWAGNRLELGFAAQGADPRAEPDWERRIILRGNLFRKLVQIVET
ncbi:hypothetical protein [Falsirhodobacter halotolerans]|uniref:hypothetical protein n=1 Tax=Falsirhodobacter halotolerans TaxID=1146892 RepID=UPI001FD5218D|nr:hypothetical protein [Falsirhodobacter halotolerans]MCJ8141050.1 hypothetical protein [Falsirhodobacter halotolerans]